MIELPKPHYHRAVSDPEWLVYATQFHGHLGPWAVAGLRAGAAGRLAVEAEGHFDVSVTVEGPFVKTPNSCFLDGLQVATGATLGKRNLQWVPAEKIDRIVVRVENTRTGRVAEVRPTDKMVEFLTLPKPATEHDRPEKDHADRFVEALARKVAAAPQQEILSVTLPGKEQPSGCTQ